MVTPYLARKQLMYYVIYLVRIAHFASTKLPNVVRLSNIKKK